MATTDPFIANQNTIEPFTVGTSQDQYSLKLSLKPPGSDLQVYNYVGAFDTVNSTIEANAVGIQSQVMVAIETAIKNLYFTSYNIGHLPTLGKPLGIPFEVNDIVVSASRRGDYFVFRGTGSNPGDRTIFFKGEGVNEVWDPQVDPTPPLNPTNHSISYPTVTYSSTGVIQIIDSIGRQLDFESGVTNDYGVPPGQTAMVSTTNTNSTTYLDSSDADIGVTVITTIPPNEADIEFAQAVIGYFYGGSPEYTYLDLYNYIIAQEPTLTNLQKGYIKCMCKAVYIPISNAVKFVFGDNVSGSFAVNSGYGAFTTARNMSLEIRVT